MIIAYLTQTQAESLMGQEYNERSIFNPIQDENGNWFIGIDEIQNNINPNFIWLNNLDLTEVI